MTTTSNPCPTFSHTGLQRLGFRVLKVRGLEFGDWDLIFRVAGLGQRQGLSGLLPEKRLKPRPRPESGRDCLSCAELSRDRVRELLFDLLVHYSRA